MVAHHLKEMLQVLFVKKKSVYYNELIKKSWKVLINKLNGLVL